MSIAMNAPDRRHFIGHLAASVTGAAAVLAASPSRSLAHWPPRLRARWSYHTLCRWISDLTATV
jgi:hypothetical protein